MNNRSWIARLGMAALVLAFAGSARAQAPAPAKAPDSGGLEVEPIRCWWKTSKGSLVVGERFTLTLTCGIVETARIKAVADLNQLQPTAIQLPPYEVVSGVRHDDIEAPPWRYVQHEYIVRLIGDTFFGKDVDIPPLKITYHIESSIGGASEGRDQSYVLPPLPMRLASLVPQKADDIRDASRDTFADIQERRARSTGVLVAAAIFFAFAAVFIVVAAVRFVGRYRVRTPGAARRLPMGAVLTGCLSAVRRLKSEVARDGWTPELAGRALALLRIAGAVALGAPVTQTLVNTKVSEREGQLAVPKGMLRRKRVLISTPTTADALASALRKSNGALPTPRTKAILTDLQDSLRLFTAARYGRNGNLDTTALDTALDNGVDAMRRLRTITLWPMRVVGGFSRPVAETGETMWSR